MMRWTKRNKLIAWLGAVGTFLIIVALALNFAVDLFLRSMVPTSIDEVMEQVEASEATATDATATSNPSTEATSSDGAQQGVNTDDNENVATEQTNSEGAVTEKSANEAGSSDTPVEGTEPAPSSEASLSYSPEITPEKAKLVEEEITIKEKTKVLTTLMGKLSPSEIALFTRMASNGLTVEEKKEAKKVFLKKLSEDEYNQLIAIASKYGLSQGKSHEDSLKDMEAE